MYPPPTNTQSVTNPQIYLTSLGSGLLSWTLVVWEERLLLTTYTLHQLKMHSHVP